MNKVILIITNNLENARLAGLCAREVAGEFFDEESLAKIELAIIETVNNCIEHAYDGFGNHQIAITFYLTDERFSIEITDQGKAIESKQLENINQDFYYDPEDIGNLPEGGMGLKIIKNCVDEVIYQNVNGSNRWLLMKRIKS